MNLNHIFVYPLVALLCLVGCSAPEKIAEEEVTALEVSGIASLQNVPAEQGHLDMTIVADKPWNIEVSESSWLHLDVLSASESPDGKSVTISWDASDVEEVRRTSFAVKAGNAVKSFTVLQAAYEKPQAPVQLSVSGITDNKVALSYEAAEIEFKVSCNYSWSIEATGLAFCTFTPLTGDAGTDISVKLAVSENEVPESRSGSFVVRCKKESVTVTLEQGAAPDNFDTHAAGFVFFEDDFTWVAQTWDVTYPKYGWVSAKTDGSHNNEYVINNVAAAKAAADEKGYECDALCYAKAEGLVKLGKAAQTGSILSPALSLVDAEKIATIDVAFNAALYCSASEEADSCNEIELSVVGDGTVKSCGTSGATISQDKKSVKIPLSTDADHIWVWTRKHVLISGVTNTTRIKFGNSDEIKCRWFLDNIKIVRAVNSGSGAEGDSIEIPALDSEMSLAKTSLVSSDGGVADACIRVNRDWTVTSNASWLTIAKIGFVTSATATNSDGVSIASNGLSATVRRTGMPYKVVLSASANEGESLRNATLSVSADGKEIGTIEISQAGKSDNSKVIAKWSWTALYSEYNTNVNPNKTLYNMALNWVSGDHSFASDIVSGGMFRGVSSTTEWSCGTNNQTKDRLRNNKLSKGDYFEYAVSNVTAPAGSVIKLAGPCIATTNVSTGPCEWTEEYSLDGGSTWTTIRDIKLTGANVTSAGSLDCEITLENGISGADVRIRVRIASNKTATSTFVDGASNMAYVSINGDSNISTSNAASRDAYYTDNWAFVTISLIYN